MKIPTDLTPLGPEMAFEMPEGEFLPMWVRDTDIDLWRINGVYKFSGKFATAINGVTWQQCALLDGHPIPEDALVNKPENSTSRDRPYNGQRHTFFGDRGKHIVNELTIRDVCDCFAKGMLRASGIADLQNKAEKEWHYEDLYSLDDIDPVAAIQNAACAIEQYLGIYPNIPELRLEPDRLMTIRERGELLGRFNWGQVRNRSGGYLCNPNYNEEDQDKPCDDRPCLRKWGSDELVRPMLSLLLAARKEAGV